MSKAILVIDMPQNCDVCDFARMVNGKISCAIPGCGYDVKDYITCRPEECPLRELPEKQVHHCTDTAHHRFAKDGWNACINEILGKSVEREK